MSEGHNDERVEELLRANERLAAEVRNLTLGYGDAPRPAGMPTSRRLARMIAEREQLEADLAATREELDHVKADRNGLERQNQEMAVEIARLSHGLFGFLRRARGQLFNR
jgi:phage shock protein A